jgi:hypothetical protein
MRPCLVYSNQDNIPLEPLGRGDHFCRRSPLRRSLSAQVSELTSMRTAVLQAEIGGISHKRGKVLRF